MKKLLLILLFTSISFGQNLLLMDDDGYPFVNQETELYVNSLTTAISDTQIANIDEFVTMLKDSLSITSLSEKFDAMYILANQTAEAGLKNLIKRSHDATAVNSLRFTQWEGYGGDTNTVKYLNTNYNPNTQGVRFTQNSASFGIYSRTAAADAGVDLGLNNAGTGTQQINIATRYTDNNLYGRINSANADQVVYGNTTGAGFYSLSRTASNEFMTYKNGVVVDTTTSTSATIYSGNVFICCKNAAGTPETFTKRQYSFAFFGAGLTAIEVRKVYNCIQAYMTGIGKQV